MMKEKYIPQPMDIMDVQLPAELDELIERLSENVHETWARKRMDQGWTFGEQRNDELRQHPCLVPYDELSEEEKAYDRDTAISTLKFITRCGFQISKK
jgi:ryanodine receptor 2